jgi:hypothetical protein
MAKVIHIVKKTVFDIPEKGKAKKTEASQWQVWPCIHIASANDSFEWEIRDKGQHRLEIHLPPEFENTLVTSDNGKASARLRKGAVAPGQHFEYEVYVDGKFAHGLSAPGVIIE